MLIKQAQSTVLHSPFQLPIVASDDLFHSVLSFFFAHFPMTDGGQQTHDAEHSRTVPNDVPINHHQATVVGEEPIKTFRVLLTGFGVSAALYSPALHPLAILYAMN